MTVGACTGILNGRQAVSFVLVLSLPYCSMSNHKTP